MNLHEYQAKQLFADYGLPVSKGVVVDDADKVAAAVKKIGGKKWMVKAQVHAGGRGKAGGVKLAESVEDVRGFAEQWLGKNLITYQTDATGQPVNRILVEACTNISQELYLGAVVDRSSSRIVFMASREGGVEIEKVAVETPEKILKAPIDPIMGPHSSQGRKLALDLGLEGDQIKIVASGSTAEADLILDQLNPYYLVVNKALGGRDLTLDRTPVDADNVALTGDIGILRDGFRIFSHRILKTPVKKSEDFEIVVRWRIILN
jgi:succinyl-CoA synthetase beta subunit